MKRFLSTLLLVSFCAVQAAPMEKFSNAVSDADAVLFETLLQQHTLNKPEVLELLNEANLQLKLRDKIYWKSFDFNQKNVKFFLGVSTGFSLAGSITSDKEAKAFLAVMAVFWAGLSGYTLYDSVKSSTQLNKEYWRARAIQKLLFKKLLDAEFPVKETVPAKANA